MTFPPSPFRYSLLTLFGGVTLIAILMGIWPDTSPVVVGLAFELLFVVLWIVLIEAAFRLYLGVSQRVRRWVFFLAMLLLAGLLLLLWVLR